MFVPGKKIKKKKRENQKTRCRIKKKFRTHRKTRRNWLKHRKSPKLEIYKIHHTCALNCGTKSFTIYTNRVTKIASIFGRHLERIRSTSSYITNYKSTNTHCNLNASSQQLALCMMQKCSFAASNVTRCLRTQQ